MNWTELLCRERIREYTSSTTSHDLRTEFEKDYHRIIGSASFRRLQDKTQVFPLDKSDFIRTRLTHSLEVSSFARSLGQSISEKIISEIGDADFTRQSKADICEILQCAGLLHDIGNPPFGHFGETAIRDWFHKNLPQILYEKQDGEIKPVSELLKPQMLRDFYYFEGNTQALRVVTKLHFLVDENGMNLTKALLGTIIKYPVSSLEIDKDKAAEDIKYKKMGYYYADRENFENIQNALGCNGSRHPLTYILEAADDIAYKTADIEDAVKKGCITYVELLAEIKEAGKTLPKEHRYWKMAGMLEHKYQKALDKGYERPDLYAVQNWIIGIQGGLLNCAAECFIDNYAAIMDGRYTKDLFYATLAEPMMEALGDIAYRYAFLSKPIIKLEIAAEKIFRFLLESFVDAVLYFDTKKPMTDVQKKLVSLISDNYKRIYFTYAEGKDEIERLYLRLILVTDYVCGMTDSFAKDLYQELKGID